MSQKLQGNWQTAKEGQKCLEPGCYGRIRLRCYCQMAYLECSRHPLEHCRKLTRLEFIRLDYRQSSRLQT